MSSLFSSEGAFNRALAEMLAALRSDINVSQGALAVELGIDQAMVSRVESGQRRLTVTEVFAWFDALGVEPEESAERLLGLWQSLGSRPRGFWEEHID
ncbi:UNVERIFIED_CONTAM: helix-turn-helix transcriptional regulator [Actinomycetes bacterium ARC8]|nr:helix-turn-helix transcriptional regulator [Actinomycetes bacterium ARC8]